MQVERVPFLAVLVAVFFFACAIINPFYNTYVYNITGLLVLQEML